MLLSGSLGAFAQEAPAVEAKTLSSAPVREKTDPEQGRDRLRVSKTGIARGTQDLRDIPQSVTVITEKLMDDRNLDTLKEALQYTAGISFLAVEGAEEDIRLRGFSLQATGDIFVDVLLDPAFCDRDTFNFGRIEAIRGSASMLFGRGSTGGTVNQVSKVPRLMDEYQVDITVGSHNFVRVTGDFNAPVGEAAALQGDLPLLVDGGIRCGTDVLKALDLGAHAVLIGRPYVFGLAHAGAHGVAHVLRLLRDELEIAMALTGCRTLAEVTREGLLHPATGNFTIDS